MIIRREVLRAALAVTSSPDRGYLLSSVQIRPGGSVAATNGHCALVVTDREPWPDSDYPSKGTAPYKGDPSGPVLLPAEQAEQLIKGTAKRSPIPILACIQLSTNGEEGGVVYSATDLAAAVVAHVASDQSSGRFPDIEKVWPDKDRPEVSLTLTVAMLKDLIKATEAVNDRKDRSITFLIPTKAGVDKDHVVVEAIRVRMSGRGAGGAGLTIDGVVMPCRL